jgi:hypothetical protein
MHVPKIGDNGETTTIQVRRRNVPLSDAYAVTDFFIQGASFKNDTWVIDLCPPPNGIKRACLFVILTRYKSLDHIRLLRPLYTDAEQRRRVIQAFKKATKINDDLAAEARIQASMARATQDRHTALFQHAERLVNTRTAAQ